jgi:hypothetical protein
VSKIDEGGLDAVAFLAVLGVFILFVLFAPTAGIVAVLASTGGVLLSLFGEEDLSLTKTF